jgi:hypothetical protein
MKIAQAWVRIMVALIAVACVAACDVIGTVVDQSNTQTLVTSMHVSGSGTITVITGGAIHNIPLESFESLTLFPDEPRTINGELCYAAEVFLKDGTRLASRDKAHDNKPLTYVSVNATIMGKSNRGNFSAELTNVLKITFR